jgi:hypothetical protein
MIDERCTQNRPALDGGRRQDGSTILLQVSRDRCLRRIISRPISEADNVERHWRA